MKYTNAQLAAMRERWARNRAAREAEPRPDIGPEELDRIIDAKLAAHEAELQRLASHHRAEQVHARAASDKAIFTTLGNLATILEQGAALAAAERRERHARAKDYRARLKKRKADKAPRPGRRPPLRNRIAETLGPLKREGVPFKVLMGRWERECIGALRLDDLGARLYRVTDEDGKDETSKTYTLRYLEKLFSMAR